jgi:hypothetical protein
MSCAFPDLHHAELYRIPGSRAVRILFTLDAIASHLRRRIRLSPSRRPVVRLFLFFWEQRKQDTPTRRHFCHQRIAFFNKRYNFLRSNFDKTGHDLFSFRVLQVSSHPCKYLLHNTNVIIQYQVVAMSGEEAGKTFFNEQGLNFTEGYRLLMGGVSHVLKLHTLQVNIFMSQSPNSMEDIKDETSSVATFNKRLHKILRRDRLQDGMSLHKDNLRGG